MTPSSPTNQSVRYRERKVWFIGSKWIANIIMSWEWQCWKMLFRAMFKIWYSEKRTWFEVILGQIVPCHKLKWICCKHSNDSAQEVEVPGNLAFCRLNSYEGSSSHWGLPPCIMCVQYIGGCSVHWEGGGGKGISWCIRHIPLMNHDIRPMYSWYHPISWTLLTFSSVYSFLHNLNTKWCYTYISEKQVTKTGFIISYRV